MKKFFYLLLAFVVVGALAASADPIIVSTSSGQFTTVTGASQAFFNLPASASQGYTEGGMTFTGDFGFYTGFRDGFHRNPTGDQTQYISTPNDNSGASAFYDVRFDAPATYFGLYWGSLDEYNSITLHTSAGEVLFTGTQLSAYGVLLDCKTYACGDQRASSYFNFFATDGTTIRGVTLASSNRALEADNFAVVTPEPASLLLFGTGLIGVAGLIRRKLQ